VGTLRYIMWTCKNNYSNIWGILEHEGFYSWPSASSPSLLSEVQRVRLSRRSWKYFIKIFIEYGAIFDLQNYKRNYKVFGFSWTLFEIPCCPFRLVSAWPKTIVIRILCEIIKYELSTDTCGYFWKSEW
jgi:hypothetical protein